VRAEEARVLLGLRPGFSESELDEAIRTSKESCQVDRFPEGSEHHQQALARLRVLSQAAATLVRAREEQRALTEEGGTERVSGESSRTEVVSSDPDEEVPTAAPSTPRADPSAGLPSAQVLISDDQERPPSRKARATRRLARRFGAVAIVVSLGILARQAWPSSWMWIEGIVSGVVSGSQPRSEEGARPSGEPETTDGGTGGSVATTMDSTFDLSDDVTLPQASALDGAQDEIRPAEGSSDGYFAISLGAFRSFPSALTLIDRLSEDTTVEWSAVAPVLLPDGLYHRVLAGLRPDSLAARALGAQLVESLGDDAEGWFPRRIRVVVCTEPFTDSNSADEAVRRAREQELLGEVRNPPQGDGEVRVCFGGYGQGGDADEVIRRLRQVGYASALVSVTTAD